MSIANATSFIDLLDSDDELKAEIENLVRTNTEITPALLVELGAKNGLEFTADEIQEVHSATDKGTELDDSALDSVSAGGRRSSWSSAKSYGGSFSSRGGKIRFSWSSGKATVLLQSSHHQPE
jgi:hypothetical protein